MGLRAEGVHNVDIENALFVAASKITFNPSLSQKEAFNSAINEMLARRQEQLGTKKKGLFARFFGKRRVLGAQKRELKMQRR